MDYSLFYRRDIDVSRIEVELPHFDVLISAYNTSDRVREVFAAVPATRKLWLMHPEYCFEPESLDLHEEMIWPPSRNEIVQVDSLLAAIGPLEGLSICVDVTGFMRHVLIFLVAKLEYLAVREFTALYSEPLAYKKREDTPFSTTTSEKVGPIAGLRGRNRSSSADQVTDHLIISVGYDHKLIAQVADFKNYTRVYPVFGFPSLAADMYQQSAVSSYGSGAVSKGPDWYANRRFAPANDPFATADLVGRLVQEIDRVNGAGNIYLAPLATKVQALGFAIYWLYEGRHRLGGGVSVILPECLTYSRETSEGVKRLWAYKVELV